MIPLPAATLDPNLLALGRQHRESRTGSTSATWGLANKPVVDLNDVESSPLFVFKNGVLLQPTTDYTVDGNTVTLSVAPIAGDRLTAVYWYVAQ